MSETQDKKTILKDILLKKKELLVARIKRSSGEIVKAERPIHISNVSHVENGKAIKIGFKIENGEGKAFTRKTRISKKTKKKID
jgi:ribosomal protein L24